MQTLLIWNKALPSEQTHTITHKSCNIITDNSCIACPCWYPFWLIFPLLSPTLPSTSMHASTPLPSPPLGCHTVPYSTLPFPTLTTPPLPYTTTASLLSTPHPSAPLSFPLLPNPLIYPTLPSHPSHPLPYHTPSLLYHTLSHTYPPLPYPHLGNLPTLPSTPLPYAILSSHLLPFLPSPRISSPSYTTTSLPHYLTIPLPSAPLSHHSLSPNPLT